MIDRARLLLLGGGKRSRKSAERLDYFRASIQPLEQRQLLSAVTWILNPTLSGLTVTIPDQVVSVSGFNVTIRFANQGGDVSAPWTTNSARISGTMTTDYVDGVSIDFIAGANSISSTGNYSVPPNPADYQDIGGTTGLFTGTSSAMADLGGKLLANGLTSAFIAQNNQTYDIDSPAIPITGSTFAIAGSNLNVATLTGNLLVDGTSIFLLGQILPDTILSADDQTVSGTDSAAFGTVTNIGGGNRQLTVPISIPLAIETGGNTINGTITGQIVATAGEGNGPPVIDLGNAPNYSTTWNYAPVAIENTATVTDDSGTVASMTVALSSHPGDVLTANTAGTAISQSWNGTNLVLSGNDTAANYQQVLRTIQYNNMLPGGPGVASETATFTAVDTNAATSSSAVATITITPGSTVTNRFTFYNNSARYDTVGGPHGPLANSDDNAIATDKSAYLPGGGTANFGNYTSYSRGINGIMVDLKGGGQHTSITLANILNDFQFKVGGGGAGSNTNVGSWVNAPNPTAVIVRTGLTGSAQGAGTVSGSDRVELIWADGAIQQHWIEVVVKATANTGLASNSVFLYGNEIGNTAVFNTATVARTGASDVTSAQTHGASLANNISVTNIYDFDRDGKVNANDVTQAQTHGTAATTGLKLNLNLSTTGPFAPDARPSASPSVSLGGVSLGDVDSLLGLSIPSLPSIPPALLSRLGNLNLDLNSGPIGKYFEKLAHEATDSAKKILKIAEDVADVLHIDHSLLDSLLDRLGVGD